MIDLINNYCKILDYYYISCINIIKNLFNKFFIMLKINKYKFKKRQYTIYTYPKKFKNFKFFDYLLFVIKTDCYRIIEYHLNIFK